MGLFLGKPRRQWLVITLLASFLLPTLFSALLFVMGNLLGCQVAGSSAQMCNIAGINIGQTITMFVDLTWWSMAFGMFSTPYVSIGLFIGLFVLLHLCCPRRTLIPLGMGSIWFVGFAPMIAGIVFVSFVGDAAQCSLNAGGVGECFLFGFDTDYAFHSVHAVPWMIFFLMPLCGFLMGLYGLTVWVRDKFSKKSAKQR
ncbi:hypothetical protein Lepto7376_2484 [[Leptolyngbya] sp. PCC 7376]|uniref:hypothetical protein n=1 Tax=[Leptolyngbya] sp. PCC 7376 TaxID=111781 RepID=UPI00029ED735|nr:hypothetical protein [[Leptolyngbya] sp. PCC 7376]AFY38763.1 hypothetical protein Lepto7376_2484 [[Leptolyngbya] sp. PCC 7376]